MSNVKLKIAQTLDFIIIVTGYLIAAMSAYNGGELAVQAFIWGQVAMFWYFRVYTRKRKVDVKPEESKIEDKPSEEISQDKEDKEDKEEDKPSEE
ncbi:MAG: hypothetical protein QG670_1285, partial [Thermoproteota archaeon]|nr:hypothetical protein [Thermoproteota archaeon]